MPVMSAGESTSRLLLVANRLPVSVRRAGTQKTLVQSSGGLVAGLIPAHAQSAGLWFGALDDADAQRFTAALQSRRLVPVVLAKEDAKRHYEGYSNQVLWPLCHYLLEHVQFERHDYEAYVRVNERFAAAIVRLAQPNDTIWIHDYHLMLLPGLLRSRLPQARIGFFLHIPFPSSEVFRILPGKEAILRGLLGANLLGVHTYDYARHLVSAFRRILAVEFDEDGLRQSDGQCRIGVFPLGVDTAGLQQLAARSGVQRRVQRLRKQVQGRKVILGVDRMDYTKGLPQRLDGFARFLELYPRWREQVVLLQLAVPSRANLASYKHLKEVVDRRVGEINGMYQHAAWAPIFYMYRSVPTDELVALYQLADIALVTPTRDGMNLVAKEYVAARLQDSGVLVLSEFAGAAAEMGEALLINPHDADSIARALDQALAMSSSEVGQRMGALRRRVVANTVQVWTGRFLKALQGVHVTPHTDDSVASWSRSLLRQFTEASQALLALDYDGTLTELTQVPNAAQPSAELLRLLQGLGSLPHVEVAIISGRDPQTLEQWLATLPVHLIAEHGYHRRLRGQAEWEAVEVYDLSWKTAVHAILDQYTMRAPGSFIEEKPVSLVWHYRRSEHGFGQWLARELTQHLSETFANSPLTVLHGNKIVEVRPQGFDKGKALQRMLSHLGPFDFVLTIGDDRTDEDMFAAAPPTAWTIKVGKSGERTHARHHLLGPTAVRYLLRQMLYAE